MFLVPSQPHKYQSRIANANYRPTSDKKKKKKPQSWKAPAKITLALSTLAMLV